MVDVFVQACIRCGALMHGVKGAKAAVCPRCGWKDDCCLVEGAK